MERPLVLDGRVLVKEIEEKLKVRVKELKGKYNITPTLATILVGKDEASAAYVGMKIKACERIGAVSLRVELPEATSTEELVNKIKELNNNKNVHGILLQHPVPEHIDEQICFDMIDFEKDVDGVNIKTFGKMAMKQESFKGAATLAVQNILKHYDIKLEGKEIVVVGKGDILGKPVAMMLMNEKATVTICDLSAENLPEIVRRADILIAAIGKPKFIKADWIKDDAVLIDTGYNPGNVGDIDLENAIGKCSAYTPVPGGVGPMTIVSLIEQTVEAAEKSVAK